MSPLPLHSSRQMNNTVCIGLWRRERQSCFPSETKKMCLRASAKSNWGVLNRHSAITSFEGRTVAAESQAIHKLQSPTKKFKWYYSSVIKLQILQSFCREVADFKTISLKASHTLDVAGSKNLQIVAIKWSIANQKTKHSCCWTFTVIHKVVWVGSITLEFSSHNLIIRVCVYMLPQICYSCCLEPAFNVFAAFKIMTCAFLVHRRLYVNV